jgi:hypothetical protein
MILVRGVECRRLVVPTVALAIWTSSQLIYATIELTCLLQHNMTITHLYLFRKGSYVFVRSFYSLSILPNILVYGIFLLNPQHRTHTQASLFSKILSPLHPEPRKIVPEHEEIQPEYSSAAMQKLSNILPHIAYLEIRLDHSSMFIHDISQDSHECLPA